MGYTALETMKKENLKRYGVDYGPHQPPFQNYDGNDLKSAALRFIHERCEDLLFDTNIAKVEESGGVLMGKSLKPNQIPYNMQMDLNRLCLENELAAFIDSGNANDAYTVYYCFFEMFVAGRFGDHKNLIEMLSESESNASTLIMKNRDHYGHSVYVFTTGLAIYETNENFRRAFKAFYHFDTDESNKEEDRRAAHNFLAFWGMTALFHDTGQPFEIPFMQVMTYFELSGQKAGEETMYLAYKNTESMIDFTEEEQAHFEKLYHRKFSNVEEVLACVITDYLGAEYGFSEEYIYDVIHKKPTNPELFKYRMDHAYFSAIRLYHEMTASSAGLSMMNREHMDALGAIMLHNYIYKKSISFCDSDDLQKRKQPLQMETYPLAFLLFLCDELQCWDRMAYGRNTRKEMHPFAVDMDFSADKLHAVFHFDREEQDKIEAYEQQYKDWEQGGEQGKRPRLKEYSDMTEKEAGFRKDIEAIVDTSEIPLTVAADIRDFDRRNKHVYLSTSSFLHLYDFAVALNGRYAYNGIESKVPMEELEAEFDALSLEYKLSNINQAKSFAKYLNALDCFYTDKPVDYALLNSFTPEQVDIIAPLEHERWMREKIAMGWRFGDAYLTIPLEKIPFAAGKTEKAARAMLREQLRIHELLLEGNPTSEEIRKHYFDLVYTEKEKDFQPFNSMLKLVKKFDGLRIYELSK